MVRRESGPNGSYEPGAVADQKRIGSATLFVEIDLPFYSTQVNISPLQVPVVPGIFLEKKNIYCEGNSFPIKLCFNTLKKNL